MPATAIQCRRTDGQQCSQISARLGGLMFPTSLDSTRVAHPSLTGEHQGDTRPEDGVIKNEPPIYTPMMSIRDHARRQMINYVCRH